MSSRKSYGRRPAPLRILIGYSMRSGSTLLAHILGQHSALTAYSDVSSLYVLGRMAMGVPVHGNVCVKPPDIVYLTKQADITHHFNRFVWITRDPRDSYLSAIKSGYAYLFRRPGRTVSGIDVGLLQRWRRVHRHILTGAHRWHVVRYEDLVTDPEPTLGRLLGYLDLPPERLLPFPRFSVLNGGDYKVQHTRDVRASSVRRYRKVLTPAQLRVFERHLSGPMRSLGYLERSEREVAG